MTWVKPPKVASVIFKDVVWQRETDSNNIYLTFDDGPTPDITEWVINQLNEYNAKATFFCVGHNIEKYPDIFRKLVENGHSIGNHTYNHLKGWKTKNEEYFNNIEKSESLYHTKLFRPPYGKIKPSQIKYLKDKYKIIMWNILSGDYNPRLSVQQCIDNVIYNLEPGSIIVFHDSEKSASKLKEILPVVLKNISQNGYLYKSLTI